MLGAGGCVVVQHHMCAFKCWMLFLLLVQEISQTVHINPCTLVLNVLFHLLFKAEQNTALNSAKFGCDSIRIVLLVDLMMLFKA